jgi:dienelactone hydrolase
MVTLCPGLINTMFILACYFSKLGVFLPFYLPRPTGPFAVGMQSFMLTDHSRLEPRGTASNCPYRRLMVKLWYPANANPLATTLYAPQLINFYKQQSILQALAYAGNRSLLAFYTPDAEPLEIEHPLPTVIFSHGLFSADDHYTVYCSSLASHGYMVIAPNHTYDSVFSSFPDGSVTLFDSNTTYATPEEDTAESDAMIGAWIADIRFLLDTIENNQTTNKLLFANIDQTKIGVVGHSFGGAAAIAACRQDPRLVTAINLDGSLYGEQFDEPFCKPVMFMRGNIGSAVPQELLNWSPHLHNRAVAQLESRYLSGIETLTKKMNPKGEIIDFDNLEHSDFSDYAILKYATVFQAFANYRMSLERISTTTQVVLQNLKSFLDAHLKTI